MISHDKHFDCCLFTVYIILSLVYPKKIWMREKMCYVLCIEESTSDRKYLHYLECPGLQGSRRVGIMAADCLPPPHCSVVEELLGPTQVEIGFEHITSLVACQPDFYHLKREQKCYS